MPNILDPDKTKDDNTYRDPTADCGVSKRQGP